MSHTAAGQAGKTTEQAGIERAIATREHEWFRAMQSRDAAACESLLALGFTCVTTCEGPQFDVQLRQDWLAALLKLDHRSLTLHDVSVSLHGPVAVATVLMTMKHLVGGVEQSTEQVFVDVWISEADAWRIVERYVMKAVA
jgi:ketosteroid isomerase-like protein